MSDNIVILSPTIREGEIYARENGLDVKNVITPYVTNRARGKAFDDYVLVGQPRFNPGEWAALVPSLLGAGERVIDRLYFEVRGEPRKNFAD